MSDQQLDSEVEPAEERPALDPERAARRQAALRHIRQYGDPVLKAKALPVTTFDAALRKQVDTMGQLMDDSIGIGLAAPQVGITQRLFVYRLEPGTPLQVIVNPEVEWTSRDKEWGEEGCLSIPDVHVEVERHLHLRVRAQDAYGDEILVEASGLEARVIQHESDHLDGVLILDRTPRDQRKAAMRTLREAERSAAV
ncbi:MAG TPA: peptide deformylase [Solirubrobacteraceae bacterium]|nr:peptide deformylase [Solirubrobacteraceae bacterium]